MIRFWQNAGNFRRGCLIFIACIAAFAAIPIGFFGYLYWSIDHGMKSARRDLIAAVHNPLTTNRFQQAAQPFFGLPTLSNTQTQSLFKAFQSIPHYEWPQPVYDDNNHVSAIVIWCGGADDHFGLIISATKSPPNQQYGCQRQVAPRVWFWDEVKNMPTP
ncbi:MAG TPA: hypothetical protein VG722_01485 [Tepidisphaeraceae bacterium]|nr:hypothetical protein [Tepidisphaeraceae bacterium]